MTDKASMSVLVLDDEPMMVHLLSHLLNGLGYQTLHTFLDGDVALSAIDRELGLPQLILLDINMPSMDGVEFVRHLAERKYRGCLVLVSGEDELMMRATEKLAQSYELSILGKLQKPPTADALANMLAKCCAMLEEAEQVSRKAEIVYTVDELRHAIDHNELVTYYQPKVSLKTGKVSGFEALVRWQHPRDGLVFPDSFIPLAEAGGLIRDLTHWVLSSALVQLKVWQDAGLTFRLGVNVSMDDLSDIDFANYVIAETEAVGVTPERLVLEVTESRLMLDMTTTLDVLTRLRLKRFHLSIDDFGTGHSSLKQLRDLPFNELKVDQGFTHRAWQDDRRKAIFEASLALGTQLGMEVVAEGVEDIRDWAFLRATDCHLAQGYFISKPMPADDVLPWLEIWSQILQQQGLVDG